MAGKRDALPQHEIDLIVARIKKGESLESIYGELKRTVEDIWFERNAESLYKLAGVDPERDEHQEDLDDVLGAPEPTGEEPPPAAPAEPVAEAPVQLEAAPLSEKEVDDLVAREPEARELRQHGKGKHRK